MGGLVSNPFRPVTLVRVLRVLPGTSQVSLYEERFGEMARVIGIGIDAGTIGLIDELIAGGSLPNLAALRERSIRTQLDAAPNHQFGVVWPQFIAGAEAELAGEWLRFSFDRQAYEGYQSGARHR